MNKRNKPIWVVALKKCIKQKEYGHMDTCSLCETDFNNRCLKKCTTWPLPCSECICKDYYNAINKDKYSILDNAGPACVELADMNPEYICGTNLFSKEYHKYIRKTLRQILKWVEEQ